MDALVSVDEGLERLVEAWRVRGAPVRWPSARESESSSKLFRLYAVQRSRIISEYLSASACRRVLFGDCGVAIPVVRRRDRRSLECPQIQLLMSAPGQSRPARPF